VVEVWEVVSITLLGLFAMGSIDGVSSGAKDVGSYGTTTVSAVEIFFFLFVFAVIAIIIRAYFNQ
jgi:hypothetical protein